MKIWLAAVFLTGSVIWGQTDPSAAFNQGLSLHTQGSYDEAIASFQTALKAGFRPPGSMYRIARAYAKKGDRDHAIEWLQKAADAGFPQLAAIQTDADLASVRQDSRFNAIVAKVEATARPCMTTPEHRHFDFWVGEWNVTTSGQPAGTNSIQRIVEGCIIFENWTGLGGVTGKSFNFYDSSVKKWKQVWVDSTGSVLELSGEFKDGAMRYAGTTGAQTHRLTFTPLPDGKVRQLWEQSSDGGKTWQVAFDGLYTRK